MQLKRKIIYAANNFIGSPLQALRITSNLNNHNLKIFAYNNSKGYLDFDWNLDSLLNISKPEEKLTFTNDNFKRFLEYIESFSPDLIISEMEPYTSSAAIQLKIPLWQVSSTLFYHAIDDKFKNSFQSIYGTSLGRNEAYKAYLRNITLLSQKRFVYSHFCDVYGRPLLNDGFTWVRPYFELPKVDENIIQNMIYISRANPYFFDFEGVIYSDIKLSEYNRNIRDYKNIGDYDTFICGGETSILADCFYSEKKSIIVPFYEDKESMINAFYSEYLALGKLYKKGLDLKFDNFSISLNSNAKFLHEHVNSMI